jgi:hypothetical protein
VIKAALSLKHHHALPTGPTELDPDLVRAGDPAPGAMDGLGDDLDVPVAAGGLSNASAWNLPAPSPSERCSPLPASRPDAPNGVPVPIEVTVGSSILNCLSARSHPISVTSVHNAISVSLQDINPYYPIADTLTVIWRNGAYCHGQLRASITIGRWSGAPSTTQPAPGDRALPQQAYLLLIPIHG